MRILLDESIPSRLGALLTGHESVSVQRQGWSGIKNGELLALAGAEFDVFVTADKRIEYQQNLAKLPISVLVILARSNRLEDMQLLVPEVLSELDELPAKTLRKVAG